MKPAALNDRALRAANTNILLWHGSEAGVGYEAFRTWVLATLKQVLAYDGAIWGLLPQGADAEDGVCGARLHGLGEGVLQGLLQARGSEFAAGWGAGDVSHVCMADAHWQGPQHALLRSHAQRHGLADTLLACFSDAVSPGRQFVLLSRSSAAPRFNGEDLALFALQAPHMMQAYALRRRLFLDKPRNESNRSAVAAAVIDRAGYVHDQHHRFNAIFQREWSDWGGDRLPEPLLELAARRAGTRWRFVGQQITAEFVPIDDSYVVTARPRRPADELTERELDVARRYAAGGSFREIAGVLELAPATVRSHLRSVFGKLQIRNKAQLADLLR